MGTMGTGLSQKQQLAVTGLSLALNWLSNRHHKDDSAAEASEQDPSVAAQRDADEAAVQAAIARADQASSELANERAALTSGADPSSLGGLAGTDGGDPNVALRNQLTSGEGAADAPSPQVASNDPSDQMAQLRAQLTAQATLQDDPSATVLPAPPTIQDLDAQGTAEANSLGIDWAQGYSNLKDAALNEIGSAVKVPAPSLDDDYLKKGTESAIQSVVPEANGEEATLGSVAQEKMVGVATDKVVDTLTEEKDKTACSGQGSQIQQDGCMIFMAPTNIGRGLYNYGVLLVNRFGTMMTDVNTELSRQPQ